MTSSSPTKMADMNGVQRREVMRTDDPFGIPACFYWTVDEVADWIESIGYGKYKVGVKMFFLKKITCCWR